MKKQGFTLMELILSIVLVTVMLVTMVGTLIKIRESYSIINQNIEARTYKALIAKVINEHFMNNGGVKKITCSSDTKCDLILGNNKFMILEILNNEVENEDVKDSSNNVVATRETQLSSIKYYGNDYDYTKTIKSTKLTYTNGHIITDGYSFKKINAVENSYSNVKNSNLKDTISDIVIQLSDTNYNIELFSNAKVDFDEFKRYYTLTYDNNGGYDCLKEIRKDGETWGPLCRPKTNQSGYSFLGWFNQPSSGHEITNSSIAEGNITVYAQWTNRRFTCAPGTYLKANTTTCSTCPIDHYCGGLTNVLFDKVNDQGIEECLTGYHSTQGTSNASGCKITCADLTYLKTQNDSSCTACASGYVSASHQVIQGNTSSCTACGAGKYANGTTCSNCPTADSGWTATSPASSDEATDCYEYQTPANCSSGSVKRVATSASAYGTDITLRSTLKANANYYTTTTATSCTACPTNYPTSAANTNSGSSACYLTTTATKFVSTANAAQTDCTAGGYCPGGITVNYGQTGGRTACPTGYTSAAKSSAETACKITCSAGTRVTTARGQCTGSCDTGYEIAEHTVNVPNTSAACTIKKYTITFDCNGGTGTAPSSQTINNGSNVDLTVRCTGYKITTGTSGSVKYQTGWSTTANGSALTSYSPTSSQTLFAVYTNLLTYSGSYNVLNDGSGNWRVKLLSSGTLSVAKSTAMDLFAVGGGGGGSKSVGTDCQLVTGGGGVSLYLCEENGASCSSRRAGGGGGYTTTVTNQSLNGNYTVTIGAGGEVGYDGNATSLGNLITAAGGEKAASYSTGGAGGSGGAGCSGSSGTQSAQGGSNGSNGEDGQTSGHGGAGQGTTTKEFGTGDLYAGGGGGNPGHWAGGSGGGGAGCSDGVANTGGGGGGSSGAGGSGIVVIRNKR